MGSGVEDGTKGRVRLTCRGFREFGWWGGGGKEGLGPMVAHGRLSTPSLSPAPHTFTNTASLHFCRSSSTRRRRRSRSGRAMSMWSTTTDRNCDRDLPAGRRQR